MKIEEQVLDNLSKWMEKQKGIPKGWIYLGDKNERYILGQPGERNMLVLGVNPSTASPGEENIDPTIRNVRRFTAGGGFDGWIMMNLYPLRATNPKDLPLKKDDILISKNVSVLKALVKHYRIDGIWAAWGNLIDTRSYLRKALYEIRDELPTGLQWYHRWRLTKTGNPRHPLYQPNDLKFERFQIVDYLVKR